MIYFNCNGIEIGEKFYALNPDGTLKWESKVGGVSSPAIGADGTIYVGGLSGLYAFGASATTSENGGVKGKRA